MRIEIYLEGNDTGSPIEIANALINNRLKGVDDLDMVEVRKNELAEIAEHIQVFLKHWNVL